MELPRKTITDHLMPVAASARRPTKCASNLQVIYPLKPFPPPSLAGSKTDSARRIANLGRLTNARGLRIAQTINISSRNCRRLNSVTVDPSTPKIFVDQLIKFADMARNVEIVKKDIEKWENRNAVKKRFFETVLRYTRRKPEPVRSPSKPKPSPAHHSAASRSRMALSRLQASAVSATSTFTAARSSVCAPSHFTLGPNGHQAQSAGKKLGVSKTLFRLLHKKKSVPVILCKKTDTAQSTANLWKAGAAGLKHGKNKAILNSYLVPVLPEPTPSKASKKAARSELAKTRTDFGPVERTSWGTYEIRAFSRDGGKAKG